MEDVKGLSPLNLDSLFLVNHKWRAGDFSVNEEIGLESVFRVVTGAD